MLAMRKFILKITVSCTTEICISKAQWNTKCKGIYQRLFLLALKFNSFALILFVPWFCGSGNQTGLGGFRPPEAKKYIYFLQTRLFLWLDWCFQFLVPSILIFFILQITIQFTHKAPFFAYWRPQTQSVTCMMYYM